MDTILHHNQPSVNASTSAPELVTRGHLLQPDSAHIDWLAFTLPCLGGESPASLSEWILTKLPLGATPLERGRMGYDRGWQVPGGGLVLFHPNQRDMGVHVELNADTLGIMDNNPVALVAWVLVEQGKITRMDVAIDTDRVTMQQVIDAQENGTLVSRAQNRRLVHGYHDNSNTLYIGAPSSRRLVRFYDKAKEQKLEDSSVVWTRCEVQLRAEQSQAAAIHICDGKSLADLVFSCVDFRDNTDTNITRRERCPWWSEWVGAAVKLSFAPGKKLTETVEQVYEWVRKQVAPSLAFLDKFFERDPRWLFDMLDANQYRVSAHRLALLATC